MEAFNKTGGRILPRAEPGAPPSLPPESRARRRWHGPPAATLGASEAQSQPETGAGFDGFGGVVRTGP